MGFVGTILTNYIIPVATSPFVTKKARCLCMIPTLEWSILFFQGIKDLYGYDKEKQTPYQLNQIKSGLALRATGVIVLGACAINRFPGSATVGAIGYIFYAKRSVEKEFSSYRTSYFTIATYAALKALSLLSKAVVKKTAQIVGKTVSSAVESIAKTAKKVGAIFLHALYSPFKLAPKVLKIAVKIAGIAAKICFSIFRHPLIAIATLSFLATWALVPAGTTAKVSRIAKDLLFYTWKAAIFLPKITASAIFALRHHMSQQPAR